MKDALLKLLFNFGIALFIISWVLAFGNVTIFDLI